MNTDIRKISVGREYPDGAIHYQVGKTIRLQHVPYEICEISINRKLKEEEGKTTYDIFIKNDDGTVLWKNVDGLPVMVENNVNFD
jgi:hypothetical protein